MQVDLTVFLRIFGLFESVFFCVKKIVSENAGYAQPAAQALAPARTDPIIKIYFQELVRSASREERGTRHSALHTTFNH